MDIKVRYVCDGYFAYACPRCLNGTMNREQDKGSLPYLKCILCGREVRQEKKFGKTGKNVSKRQKSEAETEKISENKDNKTSIKSPKWQFAQS